MFGTIEPSTTLYLLDDKCKSGIETASTLALLRVLEPKVDNTHALGLCNVDPIHLFRSTPVHYPDSLLLKDHA